MLSKKQWFDRIASGEKREEYREITDYWAMRLVSAKREIEYGAWLEMLDDMRTPRKHHASISQLMDYFGVEFRAFETVHFRNGYRREAPTMDLKIKGITIKPGLQQWGRGTGEVLLCDFPGR